MSRIKPSVAICIPTFNQSKFIGESLRSALLQDYRPIEIWISDDASTDQTAAVVKDFLDSSMPVFYFQQPANLGMAKNNNWILSRPNAEFIVQLDSDDVLEPGCVTQLLELLLAHPKAGYAHSAVYEIDQLGNICRVRRLFRSATFEDADRALRESIKGYRVAANMCMYRTQALREVDFCRQMNFALDWDLAVRIADAGWGNVYTPATLGRYRVWDDQSNTRMRRKKTELLGIESVFRDSLLKGFERRSWPVAPLYATMRDFALAHSDCLSWNCFSHEEKSELQSILCRLGGGAKMIAVRCWMVQHGFSSAFRIKRQLTKAGKDRLKSAASLASNLRGLLKETTRS